MKASLSVVVAALCLSACGNSSQSSSESQKTLDPSQATEKAPDTFRVKFDTTRGAFDIECHRDWAPNGVDRVYNLVKLGFYDDVAFFRVVRSPRPFVVQFGIHGNPEVAQRWLNANIQPDPPKQSNTRGRVTFAMAGRPDTRSTQLFINYGNNASLDRMGFAPVCDVVGDGMNVVEQLYDGYGEGVTEEQDQIVSQGNKFLKEKHPMLDYIKTARIDDAPAPVASASAAASASAVASAPEPVPSVSATATASASGSANANASANASASSNAAPRSNASAGPNAAPNKK
jgi:peptidyl-prolyl cis-trans isomerase A (cyclophilin A)